MAISGETLVVGARNEDSNADGIDGDQNDNSEENTGAAYVFFDTSSSQDFTINAGHTGAWSNPATAGQGSSLMWGLRNNSCLSPGLTSGWTAHQDNAG